VGGFFEVSFSPLLFFNSSYVPSGPFFAPSGLFFGRHAQNCFATYLSGCGSVFFYTSSLIKDYPSFLSAKCGDFLKVLTFTIFFFAKNNLLLLFSGIVTYGFFSCSFLFFGSWVEDPFHPPLSWVPQEVLRSGPAPLFHLLVPPPFFPSSGR